MVQSASADVSPPHPLLAVLEAQFVDELPKGSTGKLLKRAIDRDPLVKIAADQSGAR